MLYITDEMPQARMSKFIELLTELLQEENINHIELLFGPTWIEAFKNKKISLAPEKIKETIETAEKETWGKLSEDNIDLSFSGISIRLCNDSDIHLEGSPENPVTQKIISVFKKMKITYKDYNQNKK